MSVCQKKKTKIWIKFVGMVLSDRGIQQFQPYPKIPHALSQPGGGAFQVALIL